MQPKHNISCLNDNKAYLQNLLHCGKLKIFSTACLTVGYLFVRSALPRIATGFIAKKNLTEVRITPVMVVIGADGKQSDVSVLSNSEKGF